MSSLWDLLGVPPPTEEDLLLTEIPIERSESSEEEPDDSMLSLGLGLSEVVLAAAFRRVAETPDEDRYTINSMHGPERPNVYNDIGLFKSHMRIMRMQLISAFRSNPSKCSQALHRMQHAYERFGLVPYKPLARYYRDRDYYSMFYYLPVQQIVREVKMGIDRRQVLYRLPREYLGDPSRYLSLLKPIFRPRVFPTKVLFHRKRYMSFKLSKLKTVVSVIWKYNADIRRRYELKNVTVPYPGSNTTTGLVHEVSMIRQFMFEDSRVRPKFSHEVHDLPLGSVGFGSATLKDAANPDSDLRPFGLPVETEFQHLIVPHVEHPVQQPNEPTHKMLVIDSLEASKKTSSHIAKEGHDCSASDGIRRCKPWNPCPSHF